MPLSNTQKIKLARCFCKQQNTNYLVSMTKPTRHYSMVVHTELYRKAAREELAERALYSLKGRLKRAEERASNG